MNTAGTLWPSDSTASGWVSAAWITSPMRVRVSSSHTATSIRMATPMPKARKAGKVVHTAPAVAAHTAGFSPHAKRSESGSSTMVKSGPRSDSGGMKFTAWRPQISCTTSRMMKLRPKVMSSSGTWPNLCTRRKA